MIQSLFQEKDYLNYRYFHKRAYYLACLVAGINENKDCKFKTKFSYLNGNDIQPIVVVDPYEGM
jgi:U3 small nucleolar RNA-associated protein 22